MDTDELIAALAKHSRREALSLDIAWWAAAILAVVGASAAFALLLGPRPDFATAVETPRFLYKFLVTIILAVGAFCVGRALSRPAASLRTALACLTVAPILVLAGVVVELVVLPPEAWLARMIGTNSLLCVTLIPLMGAGPLAAGLLAMRHGAPTRPVLAGTVVGLFAGGVAATFYAANCTDDSPLFVAAWYPIGVGLLAAAGAVIGSRILRW